MHSNVLLRYKTNPNHSTKGLKMSLLEDIKQTIKKEIPDAQIMIRDDSEKHFGHAGYIEGQVTHIHLKVVSSVFEEMSRIERHQCINNLLKLYIDKGLHAISLQLLVPDG